MAFRVLKDGTIETDSLEAALELQRRAQRMVTIAVPSRHVVKTKIKAVKALPKVAHANGVDPGQVGLHENLGPGVPIKEDNVEILLKAAGFKRIYKSTRKLYAFFLRYPKTVWRASEVVKRVPPESGDPHTTWDMLNRLVRRGALKQVARGQYQLG